MSTDRDTAGRELARSLASASDRSGCVVIGIPKGGALVGAKVALELGLAYECVPICRIGMPCFPDLTLGAIDPDGFATFDPQTQLTRHELTKSRGELAERLRLEVEHCRGDREPVDLRDRDLIVVDDAAESPLVAQSAAEYLRRCGAGRLTFATPVAASDAVSHLRGLFDEVVVVHTTSPSGVARFYEGGVPDDEEISACMSKAWSASPE